MISTILTEILGLISGHLDASVAHLGRKIWLIALGTALAIGSVFVMFIGVGFLGFALYHNLQIAVGSPLAALIVGGFFILISLILLLISKNMIKKK
jgi:hypothetical protein